LKPFLSAFHRKLQLGSVVMFIDNIYVEDSSTPISRRDAEGNTFQRRRLDGGSTTDVLKNFPTDEEITASLPGQTVSIQRLTYYWCACYTLSEVI